MASQRAASDAKISMCSLQNTKSCRKCSEGVEGSSTSKKSFSAYTIWNFSKTSEIVLKSLNATDYTYCLDYTAIREFFQTIPPIFRSTARSTTKSSFLGRAVCLSPQRGEMCIEKQRFKPSQAQAGRNMKNL